MSKHEVDIERWVNQSVLWQMGNIGSEVGRALRAREQGNDQRMKSAFYRGMDLMNITIESWAKRGKNPRELMVAREQFAKSILTDEVDTTLEKYFMEFAIAERLHA